MDESSCEEDWGEWVCEFVAVCEEMSEFVDESLVKIGVGLDEELVWFCIF